MSQTYLIVLDLLAKLANGPIRPGARYCTSFERNCIILKFSRHVKKTKSKGKERKSKPKNQRKKTLLEPSHQIKLNICFYSRI